MKSMVWPPALAFENGELLTEGQDFQGGIGSRPEGGRGRTGSRTHGFNMT